MEGVSGAAAEGAERRSGGLQLILRRQPEPTGGILERETCQKRHRLNEAWLLFARQDDKLVGMIGAFIAEDAADTATIVSVYVPREARRQGISTRLMEEMLHVLSQVPALKKARLRVNVTQLAAIHLYRTIWISRDRTGAVHHGCRSGCPATGHGAGIACAEARTKPGLVQYSTIQFSRLAPAGACGSQCRAGIRPELHGRTPNLQRGGNQCKIESRNCPGRSRAGWMRPPPGSTPSWRSAAAAVLRLWRCCTSVPWSTFIRVPTDKGTVLTSRRRRRHSPSFEAPLTQALSRWRPDVTVPVIASRAQHGWFLSEDAGVTLRERLPGRGANRALGPAAAHLRRDADELASHRARVAEPRHVRPAPG